jgi:hypothetical protein
MRVNMVVLGVLLSVLAVGVFGGFHVLSVLGVFSAFPLFFGMIIESRGNGGGGTYGVSGFSKSTVESLLGDGKLLALLPFSSSKIRIPVNPTMDCAIEYDGKFYQLSTIKVDATLHGLHSRREDGTFKGDIGDNWLLVSETGAVALSATMLLYFVYHFASLIPLADWKMFREVARKISTGVLGGPKSAGAKLQGKIAEMVTQPVVVSAIADVAVVEQVQEAIEEAKEALQQPTLSKTQQKKLAKINRGR